MGLLPVRRETREGPEIEVDLRGEAFELASHHDQWQIVAGVAHAVRPCEEHRPASSIRSPSPTAAEDRARRGDELVQGHE